MYANPRLLGLTLTFFESLDLGGGGICTRVICDSVIEAFFVKNSRSSFLVAVHGRLPIQIPQALRLVLESESTAVFGSVGSSAPSGAADFDFLALRRAFLESGSGRLTSISSSSVGSVSLFRFLDSSGDVEVAILKALKIDPEDRAIAFPQW
jgi:hypothetical protein